MAADLPLRDIQLPPEPAWWPPAPGWWLLLALCLPLAVWLLRKVLEQLRRRRRRRQRLRLLEGLLGEADGSPVLRARAAREALRRVALSEAPEVLNGTSAGWLDWLDAGLADAPFQRAGGARLLDAALRPEMTDAQASSLVELARRRLRGDGP